VDALFFLNPVTDAVLELPDTLRRLVLQRLASLSQGWHKPADSEPLTHDVWVTHIHVRVESAKAIDLKIVFAELKRDLLVMQLAESLQSLHPEQLQTDFDVLEHVDLTPLGFRVDTKGREPDIAQRLDQAIDAYRRFQSRILPVRQLSVPDFLISKTLEPGDLLSEIVDTASEEKSTGARIDIEALLDHAVHYPLWLRHRHRSYVLVEESQLRATLNRNNAAEVYRFFFEEAKPTESFDRVGPTALARLLDLH